MKFLILPILIGMSFTGCAFKDNVEDALEPQAELALTPSPSPAPSQAIPLVPQVEPEITPQVTPLVVITPKMELTQMRRVGEKSETLQARKFIDSKTFFTTETPFGIPNDMTQDLEFEIIGSNLALKDQNSLTVSITPKSDGAMKISPQIEQIVTASSVRFKVLSFRDIFVKLNYDEVDMEVLLNGIASQTLTKVTLLRRPIRLETREVERAELATNPKRFIDLANLKLTLVRALEIKSLDVRPLEVFFRTHLEGKIITKVETASISQTTCGHSQSFSSSVTQIENDGFVILPIDDSSGVDLWNDLNNGAFVTGIKPESSRLIGIYAKGEKIRNLVQNGYVKSSFQPISVPASCHARCENAEVPIVQYRMGQDWASQLGIYWGTQGSPAGARACAELSKQSISPKNPFSTGGLNESQVTECALWETTNGHNPWDRVRFCATAPPGHPSGFSSKEPWVFQAASMTNALTGTKENAIAVQLDVKLIQGSVRHIYPKEDLDVPSSRIAPTFTVEFNILD